MGRLVRRYIRADKLTVVSGLKLDTNNLKLLYSTSVYWQFAIASDGGLTLSGVGGSDDDLEIASAAGDIILDSAAAITLESVTDISLDSAGDVIITAAGADVTIGATGETVDVLMYIGSNNFSLFYSATVYWNIAIAADGALTLSGVGGSDDDLELATVSGAIILDSAEDITLEPANAKKISVDLSTGRTGSAKLDGIVVSWATATTYGSGGDRWGGSGSMEACLAIGSDAGAIAITGTGSHLGAYINLAINVAFTNTFDIVGGLYACVSAGIAQTMGIINGITSHIRNPSYLLGGANQRIDALRSCIYTAATAETQHQVGILVSILDQTTTKTLAQDVTGVWIQLNVANASAGGNLQGIVLDNVGAAIASAGIKFQGSGDWTYAFQFVDDGNPAVSTGTLSVPAGSIKVIVGAAVRYIPLYSS